MLAAVPSRSAASSTNPASTEGCAPRLATQSLPEARLRLGDLLRFVREPVAFFHDVTATYGDAVRLRAPAFPPLVVVSDPNAVRDVFTKNATHVEQPGAEQLGGLIGEDSVLIARGDTHKRLRQLLVPAFTGERMRGLAGRMKHAAQTHVDTWPESKPFDVHEQAEEIALDVIISVVLAAEGELYDEVRAVVKESLALVTADLMFIKPLRVELFGLTRFGQLRQRDRRFRELMMRVIADRRRTNLDRGAVLDSMLAARDDDGDPMSDDEIVQQAFTLLVAGHETTATGLAWTFALLLRDPEARGRTLAEIEDIGLEPGALASSPWLDAVCREALRLGSVIPEAPREVVAPFVAGGYQLERGDRLFVAIPALHRRADIFEQPERFSPDRFLNRIYAPYEFAPFGGGMRKCLGWAFALQQMKIILGTALGRWPHMHLAGDVEVGAPIAARRRNLSVGPTGGVHIVV